MDFSQSKELPFVAGDPQHRFQLWVRVTEGQTYLHIYWRRVGVVLALLAVLGWIGTSTAAWLFVKYQRGYKEVSFVDIAFYPLRAEEYRTSLGQYFVAQGKAELEKKNVPAAYALLTAGLARVPKDRELRQLVATLQYRWNRPEFAVHTLAEGIDYGMDDLAYLRTFFARALEAHEDDLALSVAERLLPMRPDAVLTHQYVALQLATAHFQRGRYDEAEKVVADWKLENSVEGIALLARCDWERGNTEAAINRLERQFTRFNQRDEIYLDIIRFHRALGHFDQARRYAQLRSFNSPDKPGPRIDIMHGHRHSGDGAALEKEVAAYLGQFGADERALLILAQFAADTGLPAVADRVAAAAQAQGFPVYPLTPARAQARLTAQDYRGALEIADAALVDPPKENGRIVGLLHGIRALSLFGLRDSTRGTPALDTFINRPGLRPFDMLNCATELKRLGVPIQARLVLERAHRMDPFQQTVITDLVRLDTETKNRTGLLENIPKLLALKKPSRAALEEALLDLNQAADAPLRDQIRTALAKTPRTAAP